jgi:hypothetical protein
MRYQRITREEKTIRAMFQIYCHDKHGTDQILCDECQADCEYAILRLKKCPYGDEKPTCKNCPIHCYTPTMKEKVRQVMRYAGPRMLRRHPLLAVLHIIDGWEGTPAPPNRKKTT